MRYQIAPVKNITLLGQAGDALVTRAPGLPGMGLVWGPTGYGKTTAAAWFRNRVDGLYVRASAVWTPSSMLGAIVRELGGEPGGSCARMLDVIIEKLAERPRPVMIDEADYIIDSKRMVESLRDLHDNSTAPVVLIGMEGIERAIKARKQVTGRIAQWVPFRPADVEDIRILARALCEVTIDDGLAERLWRETRGSVRLAVVGLSHIEAKAKARGADTMGVAAWGDDAFFFGDAPEAPHGPSRPAGRRAA